jgi:hypothetical protein
MALSKENLKESNTTSQKAQTKDDKSTDKQKYRSSCWQSSKVSQQPKDLAHRPVPNGALSAKTLKKGTEVKVVSRDAWTDLPDATYIVGTCEE